MPTYNEKNVKIFLIQMNLPGSIFAVAAIFKEE